MAWLNLHEDLLDEFEALAVPDLGGDKLRYLGVIRGKNGGERPGAGRPRRILSAGGMTKSLGEWAQALGCSRAAIYDRLKRGYSLEEALLMRRGKWRRPRWRF